jgi:hypothetical protein
VGPFGLHDGTFDRYMVYLPIVISALPFSVKVCIRTSHGCEDCGGDGINLL